MIVRQSENCYWEHLPTELYICIGKGYEEFKNQTRDRKCGVTHKVHRSLSAYLHPQPRIFQQNSDTGNRTPGYRVRGDNVSHYTISETPSSSRLYQSIYTIIPITPSSERGRRAARGKSADPDPPIRSRSRHLPLPSVAQPAVAQNDVARVADASCQAVH